MKLNIVKFYFKKFVYTFFNFYREDVHSIWNKFTSNFKIFLEDFNSSRWQTCSSVSIDNTCLDLILFVALVIFIIRISGVRRTQMFSYLFFPHFPLSPTRTRTIAFGRPTNPSPSSLWTTSSWAAWVVPKSWIGTGGTPIPCPRRKLNLQWVSATFKSLRFSWKNVFWY